jgi:pre-mRNA-splicing factor SYF1
LPRHAIAVYDRATRAVPEDCRLDMYRLYIKKICTRMEPVKSRPAYERAVQELGDEDACKICIDFAQMETGLLEIDRARAIFTHGAQLANPVTSAQYWAAWREFEQERGNEDTFREMLRKQRAVEASFSHIRTDLVDMVQSASSSSSSSSSSSGGDNGGEGQEGGKRKFVVSADSGDNGDNGDASNKRSRMGGDGEEEEVAAALATKEIPQSVFGSSSSSSSVVDA